MNTEFVKKLLKKAPCFKELSEKDVLTLADNGALKRLNAGTFIYRKGEPSEGRFCMMITGQAGIVTEDNQIVKTIGPGEVLGEIAITSPQNVRTATVKALEPVNLLEWDVNALKTNMPAVMRKLKEQAWKRLSDFYEPTAKRQRAQHAETDVTKLEVQITFHKMPTARPITLKNRSGTFHLLEFIRDERLKVSAVVTMDDWEDFTQTARRLETWTGLLSGTLARIVHGTTLELDPATLRCAEFMA